MTFFQIFRGEEEFDGRGYHIFITMDIIIMCLWG